MDKEINVDQKEFKNLEISLLVVDKILENFKEIDYEDVFICDEEMFWLFNYGSKNNLISFEVSYDIKALTLIILIFVKDNDNKNEEEHMIYENICSTLDLDLSLKNAKEFLDTLDLLPEEERSEDTKF